MVQMPVEPKITEYLHRKASVLKIPLSGTFELTPVCNMNCRMCYVRMSREQQEAIAPLYTAEEWIELGRRAKDAGLMYLLLTGGEPFLREDFQQILAGLHKLGLLISINTNGTLITEDTIAWLKKTPPIRMNITLYGASDETYRDLCGNPHGFAQATHAIELLQEAGIHVKINCSVTPYNAKDLPGIIDWAKNHNLFVQATSYMFPPVRKDKGMIGTNDRFSPEEAAYYAAQIIRNLQGDEVFAERIVRHEMPEIGGEAEDDCMDISAGEEGEHIRCRAGSCSYWITWDGRFLPCGMFEGEDALNAFESDFAAAWQHAVEEAQAIRLAPACKACHLKDKCRSCAAMAYTETGRYDQVPEYRCRMSKAYPHACQRVCDEILGKH